MRLFRPLLLLLPCLILAAVPGGVVIEGEFLDETKTGQTVPLDIRIHKGGLDYFGRLLIESPEGCRLEPNRLFGGSFRWDEARHVAIVSWLKLPDPEQFDIRLDMSISPECPIGEHSLEWEFSFIRNNDRETVRPAPLHFSIDEDNSPSTAPVQVNVGPVEAIRTWASDEGQWTSTLDLSGLPTNGFVKVEHPLPPRCNVEVVSDGGATVRKEGGQLTFLWFDYQPSGPLIYKWSDCSLSEAQKYPAILSYVHEEQSIEMSVIDEEVEFEPAPSMPAEVLPSPDILFEVQIAALKKRRVTDYFRRRLDFRHEVKDERVNGWVKYTTGSFERYEEARNHRNAIQDEFQVDGAFVVGRREGKRISVQEALTRTGQRWMP